MNIIQCTFCKRPFHTLGGRICNECLEQTDRDFITVRDYIYEHKHADIDKASEETGVSKKIIMHLLKEGRLSIEDATGAGMLQCEICKKSINSGRMCKDCKDKVALTMTKSITGGKPEGGRKEENRNFRGSAKLQS